MITRDIRTSPPILVCDVCGRTLLRGERNHVYLDGTTRHSVCELCISRAMQEGWVREGTEVPLDEGRGATARRRSLFGRLRARRTPRPPEEDGDEDELEEVAAEPAPRTRSRPRRARREPASEADAAALDDEEDPSQSLAAGPAPPPVAAARAHDPIREPRHVRAIPTSAEHKFAAALKVFNASEHRRTVAGVSRSLGPPTVAVLAVEGRPGLVAVIASWELCWYRYQIDLSEDAPEVQQVAQGYDLEELTEAEKVPGALADESGALALAS